MSVCCLFRYLLSPETFGYTLVDIRVRLECRKEACEWLAVLKWCRVRSNGDLLVVFRNSREILDQLSDCQLFKKTVYHGTGLMRVGRTG
jgi:hypothetical protein